MLRQFKRILVTGGAGFIGSAFIRFGLNKIAHIEKVINLDLLTYAGNLQNLKSVEKDSRYHFVRGNILNSALLEELYHRHCFDIIVHFAAETHVDRSIEDPKRFYETNVLGTLNLLEFVRRFPTIHFHHISTDEVYGSMESGQATEESVYRPSSPYAASKAGSDHSVRAYATTYGLSTTISHSTNNYGPYQYPEKFIPKMIYGCLTNQKLPVYGKGINSRDWLFVQDHVEALWMILEKAERGKTYNIGAGSEKRNIDLLHLIIAKIAEEKKEKSEKYHSLIQFVPDRLGHDMRYCLNSNKIQKELGWKPRHHFEEGLKMTIEWYLQNQNFRISG